MRHNASHILLERYDINSARTRVVFIAASINPHRLWWRERTLLTSEEIWNDVIKILMS
jgi:hypothetical protein